MTKQNTKDEILFYYFLLDKLKNSKSASFTEKELTKNYNSNFKRDGEVSISTTRKSLHYLKSIGKVCFIIDTTGEKKWFIEEKAAKYSSGIGVFLSYILKKFNPQMLRKETEYFINKNLSEYAESIATHPENLSKLDIIIKKLARLPRISFTTEPELQYTLNLEESIIKLNRDQIETLENSLIYYCKNQICYSQLKLIKIIIEQENEDLISEWVKNSVSKYISDIICGAFTIHKISNNNGNSTDRALDLFEIITFHIDASSDYDVKLLNLIQKENLKNPLKRHCNELIDTFKKYIIENNKLRTGVDSNQSFNPERIRLMLADIAGIGFKEFFWQHNYEAVFNREHSYYEVSETTELLRKMLDERLSRIPSEHKENPPYSNNSFDIKITNEMLLELSRIFSNDNTFENELSSFNVKKITKNKTFPDAIPAELVYKDEWSSIFNMDRELFLNFVTTNNEKSYTQKDRIHKSIERLSLLEEIIVTFGVWRDRTLVSAAAKALNTTRKTITEDLLRLSDIKKELFLFTREKDGADKNENNKNNKKVKIYNKILSEEYINKKEQREIFLLLEMAKKFTPFKSFGPYQIFFQIYDDIPNKIDEADDKTAKELLETREWLNKEIENSSDLPLIEKVWDLDFCLSITPPDFVSMPTMANQRVTNEKAALLLHFDAMPASQLDGEHLRLWRNIREFEIGEEVIEVPLDPNFVDYTEGTTLYYDGRLREAWTAPEDIEKCFYINTLLDSSPTSLLSMYFCPL